MQSPVTSPPKLTRTASANAMLRQSSENSLHRPASFSSSPLTPLSQKRRLLPPSSSSRRRGKTPPFVPYEVTVARKRYTWLTLTVLLVTVVYAFAAAGRRLGEVLSHDKLAKERYGSWAVIQPPRHRDKHIQKLLGNSGRSCGTQDGLLETRLGVERPWWAIDPYFPNKLKCSFNVHEPRSNTLTIVVALEDDGIDAVIRWIDKHAISESDNSGSNDVSQDIEDDSEKADGDSSNIVPGDGVSAGGDLVFITDSYEILGVLAQYGASVIFAITEKPFLKQRTSIEKQAVRIGIWNIFQDIGRRAGYEIITIATSTSLASTSALAALKDAFTFDDHVTLIVPTTSESHESVSNLEIPNQQKSCRRYWADGLESLKEEAALISAASDISLASVDRVSHALLGAVPSGKRVDLVGSMAAAYVDKTLAGEKHLCFEDCVFSIHLKRSVRFAPFLDQLFDIPERVQDSQHVLNHSAVLESDEAAVALETRRKRNPANAFVLRMLVANIPIGVARRAYIHCANNEDKEGSKIGSMQLASVEIPTLPLLPKQTRTYQSVIWKMIVNSAIRSCDWNKNYIEVENINQCKAKCSILGKCKGFSYINETRTCYLKSCAKDFHHIEGINSYVKVAVPIDHQDECVIDPINLGIPLVEGSFVINAAANAKSRRGHHTLIPPATTRSISEAKRRISRPFRGHRLLKSGSTKDVVEQQVTSAGGPALDVIGDVGPVWKSPLSNSSIHPSPPELRLAVLITVHDALEWVIKCILSIWTLTDDVPYTLYLINDQSNDATLSQIKYLTANRQGVRLVNWEAREPLNGYTRCINLGFRAARGDAHYDAYCTLNSDVEVLSPHWLSALAHAAFSSPKVGIVGPLSNAASYQSVPKLRETIKYATIHSTRPRIENSKKNNITKKCQIFEIIRLEVSRRSPCLGTSKNMSLIWDSLNRRCILCSTNF
mmetsp:Transcript_3481/g.4878  ORF Transcript_3481/g.4878 Transcript_3481/m.4878 type:complete len:946 (+) Transcript_3481:127-2964(+)|eukprot:CAMPEP_0197311276 /NCGR_PEP_ID=MMETSP0891-20130614/9770_1 /TAXON_ID=44058 ORGANISM="Aureoumbra lagunensis, Strain CCMP1510" /NCGR_SAMPLE_ID=MMETSP0891 /ASSEMBLY_ACC=CAM_ASM_000534 /LENGTH=945 /DNA_ID=CAMNT_0042797313 /DNA_START=103 /DNA_END=2940 /DNA_ORIENTATION=-